MSIQIQTDNQKIFSIWREACEIAIPKGGLTVSQWADANRMLSSESAAEPGRWSTDRNPLMREPMDAYNDPRVWAIVLMTAAQVGKSECLNNMLGYAIHVNPGPLMLIQPTLDRVKDYSKKRIAPMLRDTPVLANAMLSDGERDGDNTVLSKAFVGGHLSMVGANASSPLASQPIRDVFADEIDRYPLDVDDEGSPLDLVIVRTTTFEGQGKAVLTSTPTVKGESAVEDWYERSDKCEPWVPCPHCGEYQRLVWKDERGQHRLVWEVSSEDPEIVTSVYYVCVNGCVIENHHKPEMFAQGEWRATKPFNGIRGFGKLNALYSVWLSWKKLAEKFIQAVKKPESLKVFVNTMLGETWDRDQEKSDIVGLEGRCETLNCSHLDIEADVPLGGLILTSGVDVQPNRLECEIVAWGQGEESWSIDYRIIYGDTSTDDPWLQLKEILMTEWVCERQLASGEPLKRRIAAMGIDSGGHNQQDVYRFVRANRGNHVFAIHGIPRGEKAIISRPSQQPGGILLRGVGTRMAKDVIFSHLRQSQPGEGYCHFPKGYPDEYFKQLTSEKRVRKLKKFDKNDPHGYSSYEYKKIRARNEALDCRVYAYAMLILLQVSFENLQREENLTCERKKEKIQNDVVRHGKTTSYSARKGGGLKGGIHGYRR
jgi:phage terminase large subunit GpA-like protein